MALRIYNSLTQKKEEFTPLDPAGKEVKIYVCGPTVYDEPHIGHLRSAYCFEVIRNYLKYSGYKVTFVRNVTDVDDKIIEKAAESGAKDLNPVVKEVAEKYFDLYKADLKKLDVQDPDKEPRATQHIPQMISLIAKLLEKGAAYASGGDVYFEVNRFGNYGKLSHQNKEAMRQTARVDKNEKKRDALDFALWKKAKPEEPSWESPWGRGRPGWHIECSAMSLNILGDTFDIHGGGRDLIFPHHENEIAQSESVTGKPFARIWMHHGLVTVREQKMSKSLKNFLTLRDIAAQDPSRIEDLKFVFLETHYSLPLDYSEERMEMEKTRRKRFRIFLESIGSAAKSPAPDDHLAELKNRFKETMDDNFNTSLALTVMREIVDYAYQTRRARVPAAAANLLRELGGIMGLFKPEIPDESLTGMILDKIRERDEAKKLRDFKRADDIRQELLTKYKIALSDTPKGTQWRKA